MGLIDSIKRGASNTVTNLQSGARQVGSAVQSTASSAASSVASAAQVGAQRFQDGFETARQSVASGVGSLNPLQGGGPDKQYDGAFVGAGGQTFPANTPLSQIPATQPAGGVRNNETLIYVNGINTTKDAQFSSIQDIANSTGSQVIGIHNATEGMTADLAQCVQDKLDKGVNPAVDTLANTVYSELKAGHDIHLMGHSQGGLITSRALTHVQQRLMMEDGMSQAQAEQLMSHVKVETFGAAASHYPDGPQYVHYINRADPVPELFGLGPGASWDPTVDGGKGAKVDYFNSWHLNPIASHSFDNVYLPQRVPFDQARQGDFTVHP